MRPGPDAVCCRKDKSFFMEGLCTTLHGILHDTDSQQAMLSILSLCLILLSVFSGNWHHQKPPNSQTILRQMAKQITANCRIKSRPSVEVVRFFHTFSRGPFLLLSSNDLPNFVNHHNKLWVN